MRKRIISNILITCYFVSCNTMGYAELTEHATDTFYSSAFLGASLNSSSLNRDAEGIAKAIALIAVFKGTESLQEKGVIKEQLNALMHAETMETRERMRPYLDHSAGADVNISLEAPAVDEASVLGVAALAAIKNPQMGRRGFLRAGVIGALGLTAVATHAATLEGPQQASNIDAILKASYQFFKYGVGIDQATELPLERLFLSGSRVTRKDNRTQPTLIGFYVQSLIDIAAGNAPGTFMTKQEAVNRLDRLLTTLLSIQKNNGWNGLLPTWGIVEGGRYRKTVDAYATGDNFNLSTKVFMMLGVFNSSHTLYRKAKQFLDNQETGYRNMFDGKSFSGVRENGSINWGYKLDRVSNEFSPGVAWATTYYGIDKQAFMNLGAPIRGNNLLSWVGDGFEMGWHLLTFDETKIPQFKIAHHNYLYTMMNESKKAGQPGLRSPGDDPHGGYAIGGYKVLAEGGKPDEGLWNFYTLGSYYRYAGSQSRVKQWLENAASIPGMMGPLGLYDGGRGSVDGKISISNTILGIDHLSLIAGLHAKGPDYFNAALSSIGKRDQHFALYKAYGQARLSRLTQMSSDFPQAPVVKGAVQAQTRSPATVQQPSTQQRSGSLGSTAPITEAGYRSVAKLRNVTEMKKFIVRVADDMGKEMLNTGVLEGFAPYYSGHKAVQSLSRMRQELMSSSRTRDKAGARKQSSQQGGIGKTAPLTEQGYQQVVRAKNVEEMKNYIRRVADDMGLRVVDEGGLSGLAPWYSGHSATQSLSRMKEELRAAAWLRGKGTGYLLNQQDIQNKSFQAGVTPLAMLLGGYWFSALAQPVDAAIQKEVSSIEKVSLVDESEGAENILVAA